jgi:hypothetical protein
VLLDEVGNLVEKRAALFRCLVPPLGILERSPGGRDCAVNVIGGGYLDIQDCLFGPG